MCFAGGEVQPIMGDGNDEVHWQSEVPRPKQRASEREVMQTRVAGDKEKGLAKQVCVCVCVVYQQEFVV